MSLVNFTDGFNSFWTNFNTDDIDFVPYFAAQCAALNVRFDGMVFDTT